MRFLLGMAWVAASAIAMECRPDRLADRVEAARAHWEEGNSPTAERLLRDALKATRHCPPDVRSATAAAELAMRFGWKKEGLKLAQAAESAALQSHGPRSVHHAVTLETVAQALALNGKAVEGGPLIMEALEIVDENGGQQSVCRASLLNTLASLHSRLQDPEGAQRQLKRAWSILQERPAEPLRVVVLHNLGAVAMQLGQEQEARGYLNEAMQGAGRLAPSVRKEMENRSVIRTLR